MRVRGNLWKSYRRTKGRRGRHHLGHEAAMGLRFAMRHTNFKKRRPWRLGVKREAAPVEQHSTWLNPHEMGLLCVQLVHTRGSKFIG